MIVPIIACMNFSVRFFNSPFLSTETIRCVMVLSKLSVKMQVDCSVFLPTSSGGGTGRGVDEEEEEEIEEEEEEDGQE